MESTQSPNPAVVRIVWVALLAAPIVYMAVPTPGVATRPPGMVVFALAGLALAEAIGVLLCFRIAGVARVQRGEIDPDSPEGMARLFKVLVVCWTLAESIAIYGLALRFLGAGFSTAAPFTLGALAAMIGTHPFQAGLRRPLTPRAPGRDPTPIA